MTGPRAIRLAAEPGTRREPVRGVRRATADAMVASAFTAPHVTEFLAVDVTATMELRDRLRATREYADVPLSPLVVRRQGGLSRAAPHPGAQRTLGRGRPGRSSTHDRVRLGIAAATPRGLLVPNIRDADTLSLRELAGALHELTTTARAGRPRPPTSPAARSRSRTSACSASTPAPRSSTRARPAILAVGAIKQAPWVVDGALAVRTVCQLALSFDHRLVDGEQGSRFLADVGALLTDPGLALTW